MNDPWWFTVSDSLFAPLLLYFYLYRYLLDLVWVISATSCFSSHNGWMIVVICMVCFQFLKKLVICEVEIFVDVELIITILYFKLITILSGIFFDWIKHTYQSVNYCEKLVDVIHETITTSNHQELLYYLNRKSMWRLGESME